MENSTNFLEVAISAMVTFVAMLHLYIMWFEMFGWQSWGPKIFRSFAPELFPKTKTLAANQGLYNGFLAAGLIWTFFISDALWQSYVALFFLGCIAVAGIFGALTASKKIFFVQALPALITIALIISELV